jgi:hypothetical protein
MRADKRPSDQILSRASFAVAHHPGSPLTTRHLCSAGHRRTERWAASAISMDIQRRSHGTGRLGRPPSQKLPPAPICRGKTARTVMARTEHTSVSTPCSTNIDVFPGVAQFSVCATVCRAFPTHGQLSESLCPITTCETPTFRSHVRLDGTDSPATVPHCATLRRKADDRPFPMVDPPANVSRSRRT